MSEQRVKKLSTERKKILSVKIKSFIENFVQRQRGPTFFDRLKIPLAELLHRFPRLDVTVITFKVLNRRWRDDPQQFFPDVKEEYDKELFIISGNLGLYFSYAITLTESVSEPVIRMGIKARPNALYCIILAFPETIKDFLVDEKGLFLDKFEFDKSRLRSAHKLQIHALAKYVRATWENQPVDKFKPVKHIAIQGHTDLVGSEAYNHRLGEKRATAVSEMLKSELGDSVRVMVDIVPKSYGEKYPFNETKKANAQNRRVDCDISYYDNNIDEDLRKIQEGIRDELKNDKKIKDLPIAEEIECIASKITDLSYDDQFFHISTTNQKFQESSLIYLRTELVREMYRYSSNEKVYDKLKYLIDNIKYDARKVARIHAKGSVGGGGGININDAKRMDFINDRICNKNPPSIVGCLKGFEKEGLFFNKPC